MNTRIFIICFQITFITMFSFPVQSQVLKVNIYDFDNSSELYGNVTINDTLNLKRIDIFKNEFIYNNLKVGNTYKITASDNNYFKSDSIIKISNTDTLNLKFTLKSFNYPKYDQVRLLKYGNIVGNDYQIIRYYYMKENLFNELIHGGEISDTVTLKDYTPRKVVSDYLGKDHQSNRYYRTIDLSEYGDLHNPVIYRILRISNSGQVLEVKDAKSIVEEINYLLEYGAISFTRQETDSLVGLYLKLNHFEVVLVNDENYQLFQSFYKDDFFYSKKLPKINNGYVKVQEESWQPDFRRYVIYGYEDIILYCICRVFHELTITFTRSKINIDIKTEKDRNYKFK